MQELSHLQSPTPLPSRGSHYVTRLLEELGEDPSRDGLQPKGVGVVIEAAHLCMMMRGVQKGSSQTTTSAMRGIFKTDPRTRGEFLELLGRA